MSASRALPSQKAGFRMPLPQRLCAVKDAGWMQRLLQALQPGQRHLLDISPVRVATSQPVRRAPGAPIRHPRREWHAAYLQDGAESAFLLVPHGEHLSSPPQQQPHSVRPLILAPSRWKLRGHLVPEQLLNNQAGFTV